MSRFAAPFTALTLALAMSSIGCGDAGVEETKPGNATPESNEYLPLEVGNTWTFRVTDNNGASTTKTTEVLEKQKVGGSGPNADVDAFFVRTTKTGVMSEDKTESWQGNVEFETGQFATVRYREIAYHAANGTKEMDEHWDPYKLRVDNFHTFENEPEWTETYTETKLHEDPALTDEIDVAHVDEWAVIEDDVPVSTPAGDFLARQIIRRSTNTDRSSDKIYWFVKGIGKVQETGGQEEKLVDCTIGGKTCAQILDAQ
jgi:hypothetical protein